MVNIDAVLVVVVAIGKNKQIEPRKVQGDNEQRSSPARFLIRAKYEGQ